MAAHVARNGHPTLVWNRTPGKAGLPLDAGAQEAASPEEIAQKCDLILLCVGRTEDVAELVDRMRPHLRKDAILVDHSTISPRGAREIAASLSHPFIDAPITGGSMGAQKGTLTIFCGGDAAAIEKVRPVLQAYGKRIERVGDSGQGQLMKMANQIAVGGALLALCESLAFAKKAGLDIAQTRELLSTGAAGSWAFENYGPKILNEDWTPGFSITNQRKDFGYCLESGREIDLDLPGTALVDHLLATLEEAGDGPLATAKLYEAMLRKGIED
jgi:3-hydroxyisobutyrate dehydrogenase